MDLAQKLETQDKEQIEKMKKIQQRWKMGGAVAGGVAGLGVGMLWEAGEVYLGKTDLGRCKKELDLSEEEMEVLTGRGLWERTKLSQDVSRVDFNCNKLSLSNPKSTLLAEYAQLGKIGEGTCKLIKNEDARLDKMLKRAGDLKEDECKIEEGKLQFINSKNETVYAPYNEKTLWPQFLKAEVKRNGKWDLASRKEFVEHYNSCRPTTPVETTRFDHWDIKQAQYNGVCYTEDDQKAVSCALKLRVQTAFDQTTDSSEATKASGSHREI